jgi:hypothetical protein
MQIFDSFPNVPATSSDPQLPITSKSEITPKNHHINIPFSQFFHPTIPHDHIHPIPIPVAMALRLPFSFPKAIKLPVKVTPPMKSPRMQLVFSMVASHCSAPWGG